MPKSSTAHISTSGVFNVFRDYRSYMEVSKASDYGITAGQEKNWKYKNDYKNTLIKELA